MKQQLISKPALMQWSHVGVVVRLPEFDRVLCWEASTNKVLRAVGCDEDVDEKYPKGGARGFGHRKRCGTFGYVCSF